MENNQYIKIPFLIAYFAVLWIYSHVQLFYRKIFPRPPKSLDKEIILITGAAQGIGHEMAMHLAKNYPLAKLVLWDSQEIANKKTANIIQELGVSVTSYTIDITDRLAVEQMAARVEKEVGHVSILINNAGITGMGSILEQSPELIEKTIQVNLISHFWTLRSFLPHMISQNHGHVVTICSLAAFGPMKYGAPYTASKCGVLGYIRSLESEVRFHSQPTDKIRFTTVFPWFVKTKMTSTLQLNFNSPDLLTGWLDPTHVAVKTIEGVRRNEKTIVLPWYNELPILLTPLFPSLFRNKLEDWVTHNSTYEGKL